MTGEHWHDYWRDSYRYQAHNKRYLAYVETHGLPCQACGGMGGDYYTAWSEPPETCSWCEGTGKVTRWLRGVYLRFMRDEKRKRLRRAK